MGSIVACTAVLLLSLSLPTGYFAITLMLLLVIVLTFRDANGDPILGKLVLGGTVLGAVYSISSGNGLHNFGIGAAAILPFLILYAARHLDHVVSTPRWQRIGTSVVSVLAGAVLVNGILNPYREPASIHEMQRTTTVPAFAGIWMSPTKVEALQQLRQLTDRPVLRGKRLLVAGPHPWVYFATPAAPSTPMAFMHFSGGPPADRIISEQLFRHGEPDAILITNLVPDPVHAKIEEWMRGGFIAEKIALPTDFPVHYWIVVRNMIRGEVVLLQRKPSGT
jgi:hypothetical protein